LEERLLRAGGFDWKLRDGKIVVGENEEIDGKHVEKAL
jgi:hypothetical protein